MLTSQDRLFIKDLFEKGIAKGTSRLATKEEISKLATKEEISRLATKEDLSGLEASLRKEIHNETESLAIMTHNEFETVRDSIGKVDAKLDVLNTIVTREHEYYIRKVRVDVDRLKRHTNMPD